ncbi:MAG: hypothetical protein M9944_03540 [Rhizobiaceae bacterium]|nr:hypothetical protein [Rhizobiaceae bacterium]
MNLSEMQEEFYEILFEWAGVDEVVIDAYGANIDGRFVAFLEKVFGSSVAEWAADRTISGPWSAEIEHSFVEISGALLLRFAAQAPISAMLLGHSFANIENSSFFMFSALGYDPDSDSFRRTFDDFKSVVGTILGEGGVSGKLPHVATLIGIAKGALFDFAGEDQSRLIAMLRETFEPLVGAQTADALILSTIRIGAVDSEALNGSNARDALIGGRGDDSLTGGSGNDTIVGFNVADTLRGRAGNDNLSGGDGNDIYIYARGAGEDIIAEAADGGTSDRIKFLDIYQADITATRNGDDLRLVIAESVPNAGDGGSIVVKQAFTSSTSRGIEALEFADGSVLNRAAILAMVSGSNGTPGDDTIYERVRHMTFTEVLATTL